MAAGPAARPPLRRDPDRAPRLPPVELLPVELLLEPVLPLVPPRLEVLRLGRLPLLALPLEALRAAGLEPVAERVMGQT